MEPGFAEERRKNRDRRKAPRVARTGDVLISLHEPVERSIAAELIETSDLGFRVSHASRELVPGVIVQFSTPQRSGRARVIWTHVLEGRFVSGMMLL